jgi:hypothetical protein
MGTSVAKTFCTFCRIEAMATECPKMISSDGKPPAFATDLPFVCPETAILILVQILA